jgi:hypothetical protein
MNNLRIVRKAITATAFAVALAPLAGAMDTASAATPSSLATASAASMAAESRVTLKPSKSSYNISAKAKQAAVALAFDTDSVQGRKVVRAELKLKVQRKAVKGQRKVVAKTVSANWAGASATKVPTARGKVNRRSAWVTLPIKNLGTATDALDLRLGFTKSSRAGRVLVASKSAARLVLVTQAVQTVDETAGQPATGALPYQGEQRVFAHYFPPYPVSIDNKAADLDYYTRHYLTINGENNKHAAYGGLLRDRPLPRAVRTGDYQLADARAEVRDAKAHGLDGFTLNLMGFSGKNWEVSLDIMEAAELEGDFTVLPLLDVSSTTVANTNPADVANAIATLLAFDSAVVMDGEHALGSFLAERVSVQWWTNVFAALEAKSLPVKFFAVFNDASTANLEKFAPISYAMSNWGARTAGSARAGRNLAAVAHDLGTLWMAPVAVQDARPRSSKYAEAGNTETLRATWERAIADGADFVQIATWNDYSESTAIAGSMAHGYTFLKLMAFYSEWFTTGNAPAITTDTVYLTHRIHPFAAQTTSGIMNMQPTLAGNTPARDTVEALVFLAAPATVTLTSGANTETVNLPAGISAVLVDLAAGQPTVKVVRGGAVTKSHTSPYSVTNTPTVQDMQYWGSFA